MSTTRWPADWSELTSLARDPIEHYAALHQRIDDSVDPVIVELCRLRVATLVGAQALTGLRRAKAIDAGLTEEKIAAIPSWPTSALFSAAERACLALAEQFCMGAFTVSDADVEAVLAHLDPDECYAFVNGVWVSEAMARMSVVMGIDPDPSALGLARASPVPEPS